MESLSDEVWDVLIAGTSLPQSLLALALSRTNKKILHVDHNDYYGGGDAGLSLQDAEKWVEGVNAAPRTAFSDASITALAAGDAAEQAQARLGPSRSYTLSLNPQIIYAQSAFLPSLVSSRVHTQLEFLAVGSWWVFRDGSLHKIPSTREDVFNDGSLSMKDKRALMKFLRHVLQEEGEGGPDMPPEDDNHISLADALATKFKIADSLRAPILALALCPVPADQIGFGKALVRIRRHMRSMGYFGPGFGAVVAKYGGNSEISQVACRAQAVGGGVYLLGHGLGALQSPAETSTEPEQQLLQGTLSDGTPIRSKFVIGGVDDVPPLTPSESTPHAGGTWRAIQIVGHPLKRLFPSTAEGGPVPAVAIVLVDSGSPGDNPIYLQVHSEDTGECPSGQCIVYGSTMGDGEPSRDALLSAVETFLAACDASQLLLWSMCYFVPGQSIIPDPAPSLQRPAPQVMLFDSQVQDIALPDSILEPVKLAWEAVLGDEAAEHDFMRFEERESEVDE